MRQKSDSTVSIQFPCEIIGEKIIFQDLYLEWGFFYLIL